jgi:hypothetical protein
MKMLPPRMVGERLEPNEIIKLIAIDKKSSI